MYYFSVLIFITAKCNKDKWYIANGFNIVMLKIVWNSFPYYFYIIRNVLSWWDNLTDYARYHAIILSSQLVGIVPRFTYALQTIARDTCRPRAGTRAVTVHHCAYICPQSACQFDQELPTDNGCLDKKRSDSDKIIIRSSATCVTWRHEWYFKKKNWLEKRRMVFKWNTIKMHRCYFGTWNLEQFDPYVNEIISFIITKYVTRKKMRIFNIK